ncbi:MAG: hypothetical protein ACE5H4_10045 [Candidatus Thorarchaeota archaeon]
MVKLVRRITFRFPVRMVSFYEPDKRGVLTEESCGVAISEKTWAARQSSLSYQCEKTGRPRLIHDWD